jgi:cytochrome P450
LTGSVIALAEHPDQHDALAAQLEAIRHAVEEFLRWVTPVIAFGRTANTTTELGDKTIDEGDFVLMLYASGNRDETVWQQASRFDVLREPVSGHVAFGWGEHLCLGHAVARLEARVFFEELLGRFRRLELAGAPERLPSTLVNSINRALVVARS